MKKVTLISIFIILMALSYNSFGAFNSVRATAFRGSFDSETKFVTLPTGVFGTYYITADAAGMAFDARATAYGKITGTNFHKKVSAYIEELDDDYSTQSGTVGSTASSLTYTITAYAFTEGKSSASGYASVTW